MAREFKPVRFFVMMAAAAFIVCGVTAFYTHRAEHGRTAEERQAHWIGEKEGEQAPRDAKLPTPAALNMMAQKYFEKQGSGNKQDWDRFRTRLGGRVQQDALKLARSQHSLTGTLAALPSMSLIPSAPFAAVSRSDRRDACVTLLNEAVGEV